MSEMLNRLRAEVVRLDAQRKSLRPGTGQQDPLAVERWRRAEAKFEDALQAYKVARWNRLNGKSA